MSHATGVYCFNFLGVASQFARLLLANDVKSLQSISNEQ